MKDKTWQSEWVDMPEFVQEKKDECYKSLTVRFRNEADYLAFAELIGQDVNDKTKSIWYPKLERGADSNLRYVDTPSHYVAE